MAERGQCPGVDGDFVARRVDRNQHAAVIVMGAIVPSIPFEARIHQQARIRNVSKTSNENAETLCVRRAASAVAIVISEFPAAPYVINVLAREIRRTIVKKLRKRFKITCVATDRLKKCDTFASMIRKKLPRAKSLHASFLKDATDHPRAPRARDLNLR
jgi:hypothetical protein